MPRSHDDALIFSEYALRGERFVARLRLIFWAFMGVASALIGKLSNEPAETSRVRGLAILGWLVFGVAVLVVLRRVTFTPGQALWWPIMFTLVDNAVLFYVQYDTTRGTRPETGVAVFAIVLAFSVARFSTIHVAFAALCAVVATVAQSLVLGWYNARSVAIVIACFTAMGLLMGWANRQVRYMFVDVRRRDALTRFLPERVATHILAQGSGALQPVKRTVTVLFSDIRDFTSMSEKMDPHDVVALLDDYFDRMGSIVTRNGGMLNKFIGDGMMAAWGVPDVMEDHAVRAVRAAIEMRHEMERFNAARASTGKPALRIGIGLHTGVVAAGMLVKPAQTEYTVLGDTVNVASRVEGLTKKLGDIVITESTQELCKDAISVERLGPEHLKGRDEPVIVYRVVGEKPDRS